MIKKIALALTLTAASFSSIAADFIEGKHYVQISDKAPSTQPKLTEFFSFYCHNCSNMEMNYMADIKANINSNIQFDTKHVDYMRSDIGTEVMRSLAVIQALKVDKVMTKAMFKAIQGENAGHGHDHGAPGDDHSPTLNSRDDIKKVFAANGIDTSKYDELADSKETNAKLALWRAQQEEFSINGVPAFVVNDKYKVDMSQIRSLGQLIELINFLSTKTS